MKSILISLSALVSVTAAAILVNSGTAHAVTFNGYDENTTSVPLTALTAPESQKAFNDFSSRLNSTTLVTESFESFPTTKPIDGLSTVISGTTANFSYKKKSDGSSGTGTVQKATASGANKGFTNSGTYPTDGVQGISINSDSTLSISFSNPLAAFGYFGTDLGDNGNVLTMNFYRQGILISTYPIPVNVNSFNSSEYFFGFIADNPSQYFDRVDFVSSIASNGDAIGIDQIKIGTSAQVVPVPEPASILGTLLFGGSMMVMKRKQSQI